MENSTIVTNISRHETSDQDPLDDVSWNPRRCDKRYVLHQEEEWRTDFKVNATFGDTKRCATVLPFEPFSQAVFLSALEWTRCAQDCDSHEMEPFADPKDGFSVGRLTRKTH